MRKRNCSMFVILLFVVSCISIFCNCMDNGKDLKETPGKNYYISFKVKEIYNDSVGSPIYCEYYLNDLQLKRENQIDCSENDILNIKVKAIEKDKRPDEAEGFLVIEVKENNISKTEIIITENAGRYKGNTAKIEVSAKIIKK